MTKQFLITLFLFLFFLDLNGQVSNLNKAEYLYRNGEYSLAQNIFISELNNSGKNDFVLYRIAECSKKMGNNDAVYWYQELLNKYKNSNYYQKSKLDLSYIYFAEKKYSNSVRLLADINQKELMTDEYFFKYGYSLFYLEKYDDAKYNFLKVEKGKYKALSQYFYAHICYVQKLYHKSLSSFQSLSDDKIFSRIVPYYVTQIYYYLQKYSEVVEYAVPLLENVLSSRESEINRIISDSYYHLSDYESAIIYFNRYLEITEEVSVVDYFQLGQISIYLKDYEKAIGYLEKVKNINDSIYQYTSYYLGKSYLKTNKKNFAINAFKNASEINFDLEIKEESLYNYFKLSYELDLPYSNLNYVMDQLEKFNLSKYKQEMKLLMINMFQSTNQYQQAFDFLKNSHLPKKKQRQTLQRLAYYIGIQHYNNANYSNALLKFEFARKYRENIEIDVMCLYWLADCYYQLNDYDRSIIHYKEFLETPSNSLIDKISIARYNLAYSYFKSKKYNKAINMFRKSINSELDLVRMRDAKLRLADSYYMMSEFENAANYYHKSRLDILGLKESDFDMDYSAYQESKCYGLISDYDRQEKCLKGLILGSEESPYFERSLIDLATLYKNQNKNEEAIIYYDKVINLSKDDEVLSKSLLNKGLIYFNEENFESSILCLKEVIENYPRTVSFSNAKIGLKDAYLQMGSINEYLSYINKIPQLDISVSAKDSLSYKAAYNRFNKAEYYDSKIQFKSYLENFGESSIFYKQSLYYYGESCWKTKDTLLAIESFQLVVDLGVSVFYEPSLVKICRYFYNTKDVELSNKYYQLLDSTASSNGLKRESIIRLMFGFERLNEKLAVSYANRVLKSGKLNDRLVARSKLIIARNDFNIGNFARSSNLCDEIVALTNNEDGSEAMYMKSYFSFLNDDYIKIEELVFQLAEEYSSNHWIAKGFILLSDVYVKQKNYYQAKATLESIIENHDGLELVNEAKFKWEQIVEKEQIKKKNEVEEVSITIGDTLDYKITYSDLEIEEEF
tara:strand:- start:6746 stop:9799 length:3054 start_codon:yes stop_codon:yes gene_type:complete